MLTRYGLQNRKLQPYQPEAHDISDLKSLLNRLDILERDLRRELNRQEKINQSSAIHHLEKQSMRRTVRYLETEIKRFKSLAQLGHLPKFDEESARAWLYGKLLTALLVEKLIRMPAQFPPRGMTWKSRQPHSV